MPITRKKGPLYLQIKNIIKDRILHGEYPLGSLIPSEPQLEKEFQVSKMTIRNAIGELAQEGYVEKRSGVGTTVIRNTSFSKLSKGKRFTEILVEEGHIIQKKLLGSGIVVNEAGTLLHRLFGERCFRVERLYMLNGQPYIHYEHYLPSAVAPNAEAEGFEIRSLYDFLEENQIDLENFHDRFSVGAASADTGRLLGVAEGTPLLRRIRRSCDAEGRVVEYSIGHYNTELQDYIVNYDA
ncbi:MAG: GntR family transcriptional regulator [Cohnella sp.]|uniref:GntR family transcriptional regulator n=1 Tax=Cohnella sp. TaxID=1883426 RepID=UPI000E3AFEC3|nr:GntR family transcriptional regulator [Cohnella sp.]REK64962.1 MAG: GntR family transcriptional regulator [Cohnella sp.]